MKKGFTLIELLAVLIILSIIVLISGAIIVNVISSSREKTFVNSVQNLVRAAEQNYVENNYVGSKTYQYVNNKFFADGTEVIVGGNIIGGSGSIELDDGKVLNICIQTNSGMCVDNLSYNIVKNCTCNEE